MSTGTGRATDRAAPKATRIDRQPPHDLDAERNVLGALMISSACCDDVALEVRATDFYLPSHAKLFEHIVRMHEDGLPVDITLLLDQLRRNNDLDSIGGVAYLAEIAHAVPTAANAVYYAKIVRAKSILRSLLQVAVEIAQEAYDEQGDARDILNRAEQKIFAVNEGQQASAIVPFDELLKEVFEHLDHRLKHGQATGTPTHFRDLDALTGGMHDSELVILAARPSMGKTALACNVCEHVVLKTKKPVLFVSLEMARLELVQRMLCSKGRINGTKFRSGLISDLDSRKLVEASSLLAQAPLFVDDTPSRTISEIAANARRIKRQHGLGLVVIDYLQLIEPDNSRDPRQEQVAKIARRLKGLARELRAPVLCLAQLNRQAEASKDNRPRLSHLRESGAIEQDADVVMFVHRDEYYLSADERADPTNQHVLGVAEIIIAKQRNGPTGEIKLCWLQDFTRFEDLASSDRYGDYGE